jgi:hypothetical protein
MCDHCGAVDDLREMPSKKVFTSDTEWHHVRSCIACFAKERGVSEQEAMGIILEECPGFRSKERRASKFAQARAEAKEKFPSLTSYLELRDISLKMMEGLFADFLDIFAIKAGHPDELDAKLEEQKALIKEIKLAKTSEQARELMIKRREIHERDELLAWKERCTDKQTGQVDTVLQDRFVGVVLRRRMDEQLVRPLPLLVHLLGAYRRLAARREHARHVQEAHPLQDVGHAAR